jgi:hypothetical protein
MRDGRFRVRNRRWSNSTISGHDSILSRNPNSHRPSAFDSLALQLPVDLAFGKASFACDSF